MNIRKNQYKRQAAHDIFISNRDVFIYFKPESPAVIIPSYLKNQKYVVLQFGYNLPIPISDLEYNEQGISGTLSFNQTGFKCFVPWESVFGVISNDGLGIVWDEDMPVNFRAEQEEKEPTLKSVDTSKSPAMKEVTAEQKSNVVPISSSGAIKKTKKRELPPYLRVIK